GVAEGDAVHLRHHHVADDDVRREGARLLESRRPVGRLLDAEAALQVAPDVGPEVGVVVYDEHDGAVVALRRGRLAGAVAIPFAGRDEADLLLQRLRRRLADRLVGGAVRPDLDQLGVGLRRAGQADREGRPEAGLARDAYRPAVQLDELLRKGQPDARPLIMPRLAAVDLVEPVED